MSEQGMSPTKFWSILTAVFGVPAVALHTHPVPLIVLALFSASMTAMNFWKDRQNKRKNVEVE